MTTATAATLTRQDPTLETSETRRVFRRDEHAPRAARNFTIATLAEHGINGDTAETARLLISEAVTNAACYANRGDITVTIEISDKQAMFTVTDAGRSSAAAGVAACEHDNEAEHGRGWDLITALSVECGIERIGGGNGNRVYFLLDYVPGGAL